MLAQPMLVATSITAQKVLRIDAKKLIFIATCSGANLTAIIYCHGISLCFIGYLGNEILKKSC
jgi:hypothetical protein